MTTPKNRLPLIFERIQCAMPVPAGDYLHLRVNSSQLPDDLKPIVENRHHDWEI